MGSGFCGLVQPPQPSQRHQIRHASPTPQRCRHRNLPGAHQGLRNGSPGPPKPLEPIHSLLAQTSSGVDQQATRSPPIQSGANIYPSCLKGSQGVTPFLKVTGEAFFALTPENLQYRFGGHQCREALTQWMGTNQDRIQMYRLDIFCPRPSKCATD